MNITDFTLEYLKFKEACIERKIFDIDEIIKLLFNED